MPEYIGAVRLMVVGTRKENFNVAEKTVPVKTDLIVLPSMPRRLAIDDQFTIPVSIFNLSDDPQDISLTITTQGPISLNKKTASLRLEKGMDKTLSFSATALSSVGVANVKFTIQTASSTIEKT